MDEALVEKKNTLDEETRNKVRFITFMIHYFARSYKMDKYDAYIYLQKYGGLDYLFECWWALHIDNPFWAARSLYKVCRNNGGLR